MARYIEIIETKGNSIESRYRVPFEFSADDVADLGSGGGGTLETPTGAVDGVNDTYTFTGPPILVFRNGVMENELGSIVGSTFVYDDPPATGTMRGLV